MSIRRSHKKSRLGCQECKRRHVKCDEARPACENCAITSRTCVYQLLPPRTVRAPTGPSLLQPSFTTNSVSTTPAASTPESRSVHLTPQSSTATPSATSPSARAITSLQYGTVSTPLNMHHMELLSHFILETAPSLAEGRLHDRDQMRMMMPAALSAPYAMYQILALAALHLSHIRVAEAKYYQDEATALQTQAVCLFNDTTTEVTTENCTPMFIFASFLGLQSLTEAVLTSDTNAEDLLDRFVTYLNLHRGVRSVTTQSWTYLTQSNLSSILNRAQRALGAATAQTHERATLMANHLNRMLDLAEMGAASQIACRNAVSHLRLIYQSELSVVEVPEGEQQSTGLVWAWPILLSGIFTDLLLKRNPESLIILSHYAVILYYHRHLWLIGNAGRMLVEAISRFLGTYWKEWLDWPSQVVQGYS